MKSSNYTLSISTSEYGDTSFILIGENGKLKTLIAEHDPEVFLMKLAREIGNREEIEREFNWLDELEQRYPELE